MSIKNKYYFDYAATTPVDPRVIKTMLPYFGQNYGNSMSLHWYGQNSATALEKSREYFQKIINANTPQEIIFTSSATESNNLVIKGVSLANQKKGKHIIISSIEHDCVLNSTNWLKTHGFEITKLPVDKYGQINPNDLQKSIKKGTILVSIIHANNEIGTIQNIDEIGKICKKNSVLFHTDASQSFGKIKIDVQKSNINLLTASSHKIYGPKGIALLYIKKGIQILPILHGGGHERGLRSSTVNVPAIVGFAKASEIYEKIRDEENKKLTILRDKIISNILKNIPHTHLNGHPTNRLSNNINISFDFIEGESLLLELDSYGIACSTGSACSSQTLEASHILLATGLSHAQSHGSLRFSLGRFTTDKEVNYLLKILPKVVAKFRKISPFKHE